MSKVKENLLHFLEKVESGNVTAQDIHNAQTLLESSVIISSKSLLRRRHSGNANRRQLNFTTTLNRSFQSNDFYTVQEVAERFKVTDKAVYKWVKQNKIEWERTSSNSRDIRIPKKQFAPPPTEREVSELEKSIFGDVVEMKLINRKDLYRDED